MSSITTSTTSNAAYIDTYKDHSEELLLKGIYNFTERLLVDKLWQGEERSVEERRRDRRRMQEIVADGGDPDSGKVLAENSAVADD